MRFLKLIFNFYINSSIHVGLSCYALVRMTQHLFYIPVDVSVADFAFFGTIVGYNFVKHDALTRVQRLRMRKELKTIALFSFFASWIFFFKLQKITQILHFFLGRKYSDSLVVAFDLCLKTRSSTPRASAVCFIPILLFSTKLLVLVLVL